MLKTILTLFAIFSAPKLVQTDDVGMIAYFEGDCPDGWEYYDGLMGRVPVGQGGDYDLLQDGGAETHRLTTAEMPSHNHANGEYNQMLRNNCHLTASTSPDSSCGEPDIYRSATTLSMGGSQPHNNMQPYLVLRPCKKEQQEDYVKSSELTSLELRLEAKNQEMQNLEEKIEELEDELQNEKITYAVLDYRLRLLENNN